MEPSEMFDWAKLSLIKKELYALTISLVHGTI